MDINASDRFEIVCRHKDTQPSNLNQVFASYGCNTLEAKVPVVDDRVVESLKNSNYEEQSFATLELKSKSASLALDGRPSRTRNRELKLVGIGRDIMIAAGKERDRSPVDRDELDNDLEEYMRVAAKLRADKKVELEKVKEQEKPKEPLFTFKKHDVDENMTIDNFFDNIKGSK